MPTALPGSATRRTPVSYQQAALLALLLSGLILLQACAGQMRTGQTRPLSLQALPLHFTGLARTDRGTIPLQGALTRGPLSRSGETGGSEELRLGLITSNGLVLGTGRIALPTGRLTIIRSATGASGLMQAVANALLDYLENGVRNDAGAWCRTLDGIVFHLSERLDLFLTGRVTARDIGP